MRSLALWLLSVTFAFAEGDRPGAFDYYVLSLSWSPNWCVLEGDARGSQQCDDGSGHGWILHGLWPQNEKGWPSFCQTVERPPNRRMTAEMSDIMGTSGLAWHQWKKHGTCSGLSAPDYYALSRGAYDLIERPPLLRRLPRTVTLPAHVIEDAFLEANPRLKRDQITITCRDGHIQEVRICLTKGLALRRCGADVIRDCKLDNATFTPLR